MCSPGGHSPGPASQVSRSHSVHQDVTASSESILSSQPWAAWTRSLFSRTVGTTAPARVALGLQKQSCPADATESFLGHREWDGGCSLETTVTPGDLCESQPRTWPDIFPGSPMQPLFPLRFPGPRAQDLDAQGRQGWMLLPRPQTVDALEPRPGEGGAHFTTTGRSLASRLFFPFEHLRDPDLQAASPRSAPSTSKQRTESPTILVSNFWPCRFGVPVPGPPRLRLSPATSCAETQDSGPKTGTWRTSPPRNPTT